MGGCDFYIIEIYYFWKVLKCIELNGTCPKGKCIWIRETERVAYNREDICGVLQMIEANNREALGLIFWKERS